MRLTRVEIGGVEMFDWKKERDTVWTYKADDLCACVWVEHGVVRWDVSGPEGRWTIASGGVPDDVSFRQLSSCMTMARRLAEVYISGYRAGRRHEDPYRR